MRTFSEYLNAVSRVNRLGNGQAVEWLFHPGMLFSSMDKWWGDFSFRSSAHEGIDITYFKTPAGEIRCFDDSVQIPAMEDGRIINICDDFLGRTLVVETINQGFPETRVMYTYAHIRPEIRLTIGHCIKKDEIIARVCDTRKNPQLPPHLHFSCFEIEKGVSAKDLNWNLFSNNTAINRVNPVFL